MEDIRLNKLIRRYQVSIDSVVDYLQEIGYMVERTPNAKVPFSYLEELDKHFGYTAKPQEYYLDYTASSNEANTLMDALNKNHQKLLSLANEGRTGKKSNSFVEENLRILNKLTEIALSQKQQEPHIKAFVESLSSELSDLITKYRSHNRKGNYMKTDFVIRLRNRYLTAINNMVADEILDTIDVPWDKVRFGNRRLYLDIGKKETLTCPEPKSKESYNYFRYAFEKRVKPIQVRIHSKKPPEIIENPDFVEVFQFLEIRNDIKLGSFFRRKDLTNFIRNATNNFQEYLLPKDRGPYLQYLVERQSPEYRYIPIFEKALDQEDAFLFTLKGSRLYIIWENINENTATYVFPATEKSYDSKIQAIYDYASSDIDHKRMRMYYGQSYDIVGEDCRIIKHNEFNQWKWEINALLK